MLLTAATSAQVFLADGPADVDPTTGKGPEWGEAAPIGLLVIVLLCVATYFLVKSLNRNLKKVPKSFEPVPVGATGAPDTEPAATDVASTSVAAPATAAAPGPPMSDASE